MNSTDASAITNIYALLGVIIPSVTTILGTVIITYLQSKTRKSVDDVKEETTRKLDSIDSKQIILNDAVNVQQTGLIEAIRKTSYAEGLLDGLRKDQMTIINSIMDELIKKEIVKKEQEVNIEKIIQEVINVKNTILNEAKANKEKLEADIIKIKNNIIQELNERLIRDK
jgi:hypothetical protein